MEFQRILPFFAALSALVPAQAALAAQAATPVPARTGSAAAPPVNTPDSAQTQSSDPTNGQSASRQERSVVYVAIEWSGYVRYPTDAGYVWTQQEVEANTGCSGFFVSTTGEVVTAGHCVDPARGRYNIIRSLLRAQVTEGLLTRQEADSLLPEADANWVVESSGQGSPASRTVLLSQPEDVEGRALRSPRVAQVVDFKAFDQGDVALLKVEASGTPALPIADADPQGGASVTLVGFPAAVSDNSDADHLRASFKTGTVSSHQVSETGVPLIEVNADINGGMSGGPALDAHGNALGVNSASADEAQAFNFITDTTDLRDWLASKDLRLLPPQVADNARSLQTSAGTPGTGLTNAKPATASTSGLPWLWLLVIAFLFGSLAIGLAILLTLMKRRTPGIAP